MNKVIYPRPPVPRRVSVAEAKARFSSLLRETERRRTIIHRRGQDVAVVLGIREAAELGDIAERREDSVVAFLKRVETLKQRFGGVEDFSPARAVIRPHAWQRERRGR